MKPLAQDEDETKNSPKMILPPRMGMMAKVRKDLPIVSQSSPAACWLQSQYSQMLVKSEGALNQNAGYLGRWGDGGLSTLLPPPNYL